MAINIGRAFQFTAAHLFISAKSSGTLQPNRKREQQRLDASNAKSKNCDRPFRFSIRVLSFQLFNFTMREMVALSVADVFAPQHSFSLLNLLTAFAIQIDFSFNVIKGVAHSVIKVLTAASVCRSRFGFPGNGMAQNHHTPQGYRHTHSTRA